MASAVQSLASARVSDGVAAGKLAPGYGSLLKLGDDLTTKRIAELALSPRGR